MTDYSLYYTHDLWIYDGEDASSTITVHTCGTCGALVRDTETHTRYHAERGES